MKPSISAWKRLAAAARQVPDVSDVAAPYGFSTRVAALAFVAERVPGSLVQQFSWRALCVACALMAFCVALNIGSILNLLDDDVVSATSDPVAEIRTQLLDLS